MVSSEASEASGGQFKRWVFTLNNPTLTSDELWVELTERVNATYMCVVHEEGDSGTPHHQGYLEIAKKQRVKTMINKCRPLKMWIEESKAKNIDKARDYIMRTGKHANKPGRLDGPWEFGTQSGGEQGRRTDLDAVINMVKLGKTMKQVATDEPSTFIKFHGGIKAYMTVVDSKKRDWMTELHILTGVPGSGKSHTAKLEAEEYLHDRGINEEVYYWNAPSVITDKAWFQGYDGESCVIINDFYGTLNIDVFKNLIDKYPYKVEQKNGSREFLARAVWVTSNIGWANWWGPALINNVNNKKAIQRRITTERVLTEEWKPYEDAVVIDDDVQLQAASDRDQDDLSLLCLEEFDKDYIYGTSDDQTSLTQRMSALRGQWDGNMF